MLSEGATLAPSIDFIAYLIHMNFTGDVTRCCLPLVLTLRAPLAPANNRPGKQRHCLPHVLQRSAEFIPVTDRLHLFLRYDRLRSGKDYAGAIVTFFSRNALTQVLPVIEGEAPQAMPAEGATRAPSIASPINSVQTISSQNSGGRSSSWRSPIRCHTTRGPSPSCRPPRTSTADRRWTNGGCR